MALSYVPETDTGHMTSMHERLERFHAVQRARGMSDSAIARLPKIPTRMKPVDADLPPVLLATKPHPRAPSKLCIPLAKRKKRPVNPVAQEYRRHLAAGIEGRAKTLSRVLLNILSKSSGLSEYRITGHGNSMFPSRVRALGILAARDRGLSVEVSAAIFGRERTAVTYAAKKIPGWLEADPALRRIKAELDAALGAL